MTTQIAIEDAIVFFALVLALNKYIGYLTTSEYASEPVESKLIVWRFRCFFIILFIYLMLVGILHQLRWIDTVWAMALWGIVLVPVVLRRKWIYRRLSRK